MNLELLRDDSRQVLERTEERDNTDIEDLKARQQERERECTGLRNEGQPKVVTVGSALVVCLNLGIGPPDQDKRSPCARIECWLDPSSCVPVEALKIIGDRLQTQYQYWHPRSRYRQLLDPTVSHLQRNLTSLRRTAQGNRVLMHYNGHGVPRPSENGEIWCFNKNYTKYIPVSLYEIQNWMGMKDNATPMPGMYILDCSNAGRVIDSFGKFLRKRQKRGKPSDSTGFDRKVSLRHRSRHQPNAGEGANNSAKNSDPLRHHSSSGEKTNERYTGGNTQPSLRPRVEVEEEALFGDTYFLGACASDQSLCTNPTLPADLFSSCLLTPVKTALRWFIVRSQEARDLYCYSEEILEAIPSDNRPHHRSTLYGELNWVFTSIMDAIAFDVLPTDMFTRLYRQDALVASLFRNFLLAIRILRCLDLDPVSVPRMPAGIEHHRLWKAWDLIIDETLQKVQNSLHERRKVSLVRVPSFFKDQLRSFQVCLSNPKAITIRPIQLPIAMQTLLSASHRPYALRLVALFVDKDIQCAKEVLKVGMYPYMLKLLHNPPPRLRSSLTVIWCKLLLLDPSARDDIVERGYIPFFTEALESLVSKLLQARRNPDAQGSAPRQERIAAAVIRGSPDASRKSNINVNWNGNSAAPLQDELKLDVETEILLNLTCLARICHSNVQGQFAVIVALRQTFRVLKLILKYLENPMTRQAACVCFAKLVERYYGAQQIALSEGFEAMLFGLLDDPSPAVRATVVFALGRLVGPSRSVINRLTGSSPSAQFPGAEAKAGGESETRPTQSSSSTNHKSSSSTVKDTTISKNGGKNDKAEVLVGPDVNIRICIRLMQLLTDGSFIVRKELALALAQFVWHERTNFAHAWEIVKERSSGTTPRNCSRSRSRGRRTRRAMLPTDGADGKGGEQASREQAQKAKGFPPRSSHPTSKSQTPERSNSLLSSSSSPPYDYYNVSSRLEMHSAALSRTQSLEDQTLMTGSKKKVSVSQSPHQSSGNQGEAEVKRNPPTAAAKHKRNNSKHSASLRQLRPYAVILTAISALSRDPASTVSEIAKDLRRYICACTEQTNLGVTGAMSGSCQHSKPIRRDREERGSVRTDHKFKTGELHLATGNLTSGTQPQGQVPTTDGPLNLHGKIEEDSCLGASKRRIQIEAQEAEDEGSRHEQTESLHELPALAREPGVERQLRTRRKQITSRFNRFTMRKSGTTPVTSSSKPLGRSRYQREALPPSHPKQGGGSGGGGGCEFKQKALRQWWNIKAQMDADEAWTILDSFIFETYVEVLISQQNMILQAVQGVEDKVRQRTYQLEDNLSALKPVRKQRDWSGPRPDDGYPTATTRDPGPGVNMDLLPLKTVMGRQQVRLENKHSFGIINRYRPSTGYVQLAYLNANWLSTTTCIFHPSEPILIAAGGYDLIGAWDYSEAKKNVNRFRNDNPKTSRVQVLDFINPSRSPLLLVASSDGAIKIWKNVISPSERTLVAGWVAHANSNVHIGWPYPLRYHYKETHASAARDPITGVLMAGLRATPYSRLGAVRAARSKSDEQERSRSGDTPGQNLFHALETRKLNGFQTSRKPASPKPPHLTKTGAKCVSGASGPVETQAQALMPGISCKWNQTSGTLLTATRQSPFVRLWDVEKGLCVWEEAIPGAIGDTVPSPNHLQPILHLERDAKGCLFFTGQANGDIFMTDLRTKEKASRVIRTGSSAIAGIHLQRGGVADGLLVTATRDGVVATYDFRHLLHCVSSNSTFRENFLKSGARGVISSFAVHNFAPLLALGSQDQEIQLYDIHSGTDLDLIKYHIGFLEQRIGSVKALSFHPNQILLAAGAADSYLSIYSGDLRHQTKGKS
eukprot:CAMPEP_0184502832 /NCGR_PEP_ID=MMETSP0113_2-20130426/51319_1 /TAXON_ID=91329 /ORGANISM="Norrisiella sphaerica, Strain BC52" /LENGTH=1839 /DNA_ID=CAMNT_0026892187 /DNA_START=118 /DNA_END=5637 /DNA_ORIENTATION=-